VNRTLSLGLSSLLGWLGCASSWAEAQEVVAEAAPLLITTPRTSSRWLSAPTAVSVVQAQQRPAEQGLALDHLLAPVPGAFAQNRYNLAQGLRPALRGFGARGNFGVRGLRVLVDGVPLTMPDGQTELDGLDLGLVERMEVLRGPASVLYGNAAGGVLAIETREPPAVPYARLEAGIGGLGYEQVRAEIGGGLEQVSALLAYNHTQLDGYRRHGRGETNSLTGKLRWYAPAGRLGLSFNAIDNRAEDPGGLTEAEVKRNRRQAAPNNPLFESDETIRQQRLALVWDGYGPGADRYQLRTYLGQRDFANRLAFQTSGQTRFERHFAGVGGQYSHHRELMGFAHKITFGFDLESQRDQRERHDNLQGTRGALRLQQEEKADSQGLFIEDEIQLSERWQLNLGLRHDRVRLAVADDFLSDGRDDSGSRTLTDWNHGLGLSYRLSPEQSLYGRIASSFETPTINELANPNGGGFNPGLLPARALSRELGWKGEWNGLRSELALYRIDLEDELIGFSLPSQPGRSFYRNAGQSRRDGLELSLDWQFAEHWRTYLAYSYNRYRFVEYRSGGDDFAGKRIPGIPAQQLFGELSYERAGTYASVNLSARNRLYADDANQVDVAGQALVGLRLGKRLQLQGQSLEPFMGVDNLFDRAYFDNVRINAGGGRYFEPGPGRTLYVGMRAVF